MNTDQLIDIVPHYVAMVLLAYLALFVVATAVGALNFWAELAIIVVVVFGYRPVVMRLGIGPESWEE